MKAIRVLIADDHSLVREGLRHILADFPDLEVVGEAADGPRAVELAARLKPDVALLDVRMPGMSGPEATGNVRQVAPDCQVLILTVSDRDADVIAAVKNGARGYLLKSVETAELVAAIRRVHAGEAVIAPPVAAKLLDEFRALATPGGSSRQPLTERELSVLRAVARGLSNKEIATALGLSEHTVKTHVRHILEKLHLRGRAHAAAYAVEAGLLKAEPPAE